MNAYESEDDDMTYITLDSDDDMSYMSLDDEHTVVILGRSILINPVYSNIVRSILDPRVGTDISCYIESFLRV